jgi:hypothetical protein
MKKRSTEVPARSISYHAHIKRTKPNIVKLTATYRTKKARLNRFIGRILPGFGNSFSFWSECARQTSWFDILEFVLRV